MRTMSLRTWELNWRSLLMSVVWLMQMAMFGREDAANFGEKERGPPKSRRASKQKNHLVAEMVFSIS
jgi:hypothetical protein